MNISTNTIVSISEARTKLGNLAEKAANRNYVILTKGGKPKAALVDFKYLVKLEDEVRKIYGKTFLDPKLFPFTREFSDDEIKEWEEEDKI